MESEDANKFSNYYKQRIVTSTYDKQREGTKYRREKRKRELKYFLELIDKNLKDKVLELGCSSGFLTKHLGKVTAIDTAKSMLEIARQKNPIGKYVCASMFNLPFKNNSFDKVITMRVWVHLNERDLRKAIREARRVLKNKGKLIFDVEDDSRLRRIVSVIYKIIFRPTGYKVYQYSLKRIGKILQEEGFKIEKVRFLYHRVGRQIILRAKNNK